MTRIIRTLTVLIAAIFAFGLIGGVIAQEAPTIPAATCAEPGSLTMRVWDENWAAIIQDSIDAWVAGYCPDAEVTLEVVPWGEYWTLLRTNAVSGDLPDIFNISQDRFPFYAENEAVLNLQPYWDNAGIDTTLWGSGMVDPYRVGEAGDLYAGPVNWDTIAVYYNRDLFDAAGLDYPTAEWTWDDFAESARALTDADADVYGAAVYSEYQAGYANFVASTGTEPLVDAARSECTLDNEGSISALNFLKGLYDEGVMPSVSVLGGTSADNSFGFWLSGRVAMVTNGSWNLPRANEEATFNWDVVQLPRNPETERTRSMLHSVGYSVASNSEAPDLAANLIQYLVSDEGAGYFAAAGGVAPANPAQQQAWIDSFGETDVNIQTFVDAITDSQGVTSFEQVSDVGNTELVINIFDLNLSVDEAVAQACAQIDEVLAAQ